jgi:hypothetical protein
MSQYKLACASSLKRDATVALTLMTIALVVFARSAVAASDETIGDTFPVSIVQDGEFADPGTGATPSISGDGRYVTFVSAAEDLAPEAPPGTKEAYVKDLHTGDVELLSRANGTDGEAANEPVEELTISADGRYAIFASSATNLLEGVSLEGRHVYRRDLQSGETALVDRVSGADGAIVTREASADAISEDGRYVVFSADVEDLEVPAGAHAITGGYTLYVRDMQTGTTTAVGRASGATGAIADEPSIADSISPDGRYVAFESAATNLVPGMQANAVSQIYLRDLQSDTTTLVSRSAPSEALPDGEPGDGASEAGVLLGGDGCEVAFDSEADNLSSFQGHPVSTPQVYLTNLCSTPASTTVVSRANGTNGAPAGEGVGVIPRLFGSTTDGREILFSAFGELTGEVSGQSTHLYVRDLDSGETTLVDRATGSDGDLAESNPNGAAISANGCRVAFATEANNLSASAPPDDQRETYVRQLASCEEEPTIAPTSLTFGVQALDTVGAAQPLTVTAGSEALQIERVRPSGADAADFIVTADECSGETLQPGANCTLLVRFAPSATGRRSASLVAHVADAVSLAVSLSGEGVQAPLGGPGVEGQAGRDGIQGPPGAAGAKGAPSVRASGGSEAKATCRLTGKRRTLICSVTLRGMRAARATEARLTRDGRTYARGPLAGLRASRAIRRGRYTLRLTLDRHRLAIEVELP